MESERTIQIFSEVPEDMSQQLEMSDSGCYVEPGHCHYCCACDIKAPERDNPLEAANK